MSGDLKLHLVESFSEVEDFFRWLGHERDWLGCDVEAQGLIFHKDRVRMVQFGDQSESWAFEWGRWGGVAQDVFNQYTGNYVFHNAKFDISRLEEEGIKTPHWRQIHDTHIMSFLHDNQEPNRKLKRLSKKYLGIDADVGERNLSAFMKKLGYDWATCPTNAPEYWQYAALDCVITTALATKFWPLITPFLEAYDLEMAAEKVIMKMETNGVSVDTEYTSKLYTEFEEEYHQLVDIAREGGKDVAYLKEERFRPNYTEDIVRWFTERGVPVPVKRKKKTGKISVDDEVLSKIDHPVAVKIRRVRHLKSWNDNYLGKILENEYDGKVHPSINPLGSDDKGRTGRMSIKDPALNVLEKSQLIRDAIVAAEGNGFLSIDYENEELRIIASLCQSKNMIEAFERGEDMHKTTAARMYGITTDQVTKPQKTNAKRAMFTKAYGGKEATFAAYIGLSFEEGARYFHTLSTLYPELDEYIEYQKQTIKLNKVDGYGHIFLSDGTRLNIPANISFKAVSYQSQGEAAKVLKKKLIQLDAAGFGDYLRLPIHDEVLSEVPLTEFEEVRAEMVNIMECHDYTVPLTCDSEGPWLRWGDEYATPKDDEDEEIDID